ncbi:Hypothetical Protein FCC1311_027652 [Hondaea fermentalgiana]|uniref:Uncharacterized protein n=1 Tax=Hondaea fermentalgiana TaxID=2315210 RepID=A0A2R5GFC0_9STRA|nr:Hypothetical Protein FCC1311_027652 [Hondaea fermentalgiana]|eukprot:GBG26544.1 Hypothetical Protein FCC1311_027652 [Hondaea fermentalgiana]
MDLELSQDDVFETPRLEEDVVLALLRNKLGEDVRIKQHTLKLVTEYLRLVMQETIDRSIAAAREEQGENRNGLGSDADNSVTRNVYALTGLASGQIQVEPTHVSQIVQQLLLDV